MSIQFKINKNFIDQDTCEKLINDYKSHEKFMVNRILTHSSRILIPNSSNDWFNLKEKSTEWKNLADRLSSQEFFKMISSSFDNDSEKLKLSNLYTNNEKIKNSKFNLDKVIRSTPSKDLIKIILYREIMRLKRLFLSIKNKILFNKKSLELLMDLSVATKGYFREIHRDSDNRKYVFLLFLNKIKDDAGGQFKFYKLKNIYKKFPIRPNQQDCEEIGSVEPEPGKLIIFKNTHDAYHSVSKMDSNDKRYFIYGGYTLLTGMPDEIKNNSENFVKTNFDYFL